jgi:protein-L-isoaspartate(D-aspartate) O-methyltransferase
MGGKLIAPCTMQTGEQALVLVERTPTGDIRQVFEAVRFVPLKSGTA